MKKNTIVTVITWLFVLLFSYAAASKLMDYSHFRVTVGKSPLLTAIAPLVAWFIPLIELAVVVVLLIPKFQLRGLYASFTLMVAFTAYIFAILHFSDVIPCSCGGILQNMTWTTHLYFNSCFLLLSLIAVLLFPAVPNEKLTGPKT